MEGTDQVGNIGRIVIVTGQEVHAAIVIMSRPGSNCDPWGGKHEPDIRRIITGPCFPNQVLAGSRWVETS